MPRSKAQPAIPAEVEKLMRSLARLRVGRPAVYRELVAGILAVNAFYTSCERKALPRGKRGA